MFQDAPIYHRLVAERGDVPARVRDAALHIHRELEGVMGRSLASYQPGPPPTSAPPRPYSALPPGL
ncbi:hypothetical protein ABZT08_04420 [Streptomyces sp. NPDC005526]|uniref:hypothetical protein n=1 Tax=unclassified Streptomyces TaxID=2593676 RepID=UPI0033A90397